MKGWSQGLGLAAVALALSGACDEGAPAPFCGDGVVDDDEACDDGNLSHLDDCLPGCQLAFCGDFVTRREPADAADREDCDVGGVETAACDVDCSAARCGDGQLNVAAREICDDGHTASADGCSPDCRSNESCGNRILDDRMPKTAADHPECREAMGLVVGCAEVCDDGNTVSGDGCSANCLSDESCPNGILDEFEDCDDGTVIDDDLCANNCAQHGDGGRCGDFNLYPPTEECDEGRNENARCDQPREYVVGISCTKPVCGDGHINRFAGEQCEDGNASLTDDCVRCRNAVCGDGATDQQPPGIEECDDGNPSSSDNCTTACRLAVCGDGVRDTAPPGVEACDLGVMNGQPGAPCSATCTVVP